MDGWSLQLAVASRLISSCFQELIIVGWTPNFADNPARVFSPDSAAIATRLEVGAMLFLPQRGRLSVNVSLACSKLRPTAGFEFKLWVSHSGVLTSIS